MGQTKWPSLQDLYGDKVSSKSLGDLITGQEEEAEPTLWEKLGGAPGIAGTGIRIGSAIASNRGGWQGALTAGGGEAYAELVEAPEKVGGAINSISDVYRNVKNPETRGETLRGFAEGAMTPIKRIGVESLMGLIPGRFSTKAGKVGTSAIRSGAMAGAGYVGRQKANDQPIDPKTLVATTATGAVLGGLIGGFSGPRIQDAMSDADRLKKANEARTAAGKAPRNPNKPIPAPVLQTLPKDHKAQDAYGKVVSKEIEAQQKAAQKLEEQNARQAARELDRLLKEGAKNDELKEKAARIKEQMEAEGAEKVGTKFGDTLTGVEEDGTRTTMRTIYKTDAEREAEAAAETAKAAKKAAKSNRAVPRVEDTDPPVSAPRISPAPDFPDPDTGAPIKMWNVEGLPNTKGATTLSEAGLTQHGLQPPATKVYADIQNGRVPDAPQVSDTRMDELMQMFGGGKPTGTPPVTVIPEVPTSAPRLPHDITPDVPVQPQEELLRFFKSPAAASGQHYKEVKRAMETEPRLTEPLGITDSKGRPYTSARIAGKNARQTAAAEGIPPVAKMEAPPENIALPKPGPQRPVADPEIDRVAPDMTGNTPTAGKWVDDAMREADELQKMQDAGVITKPYRPLDPTSESGAVDPSLLLKFLTTGVGALGGAATAEDPLMGGIIGGAAGLGAGFAPEIAQKLGPGAMDTIMRELPHIQRANHLTSAHGLVANAGVGPYMSGLLGSIEKGLKEGKDSMGWQAAKNMLPGGGWWKEFQGPAADTARAAVETAERRSLGANPTMFDHVVGYPGKILTTGDHATRNQLMKAGISEQEARIMTATNEPGTAGNSYIEQAGKALTDAQRRGGPFVNMMLPFVRTPMNLLSRGVERFPVLGAIKGLLQGRSARDVAAEQALSIPTAVGSYMLGNSMDEETGQTARRYVANAGGQNALTANMFFVLGQEARKRNANLPNSAAQSFANAISVPQADVYGDWIKAAASWASGEPTLPSGAYPKVFDELAGMVKPSDPNTNVSMDVPDSLANIPLRRRSR